MQSPGFRVLCFSVCAVASCTLVVESSLAASPHRTAAATDRVDLTAEALDENRIDLGMLDNGGEVMFSIYGGFAHQFRTNIDGGGEFSSTRGGASIGASSMVTPDFDIKFRFGYEFDHYNFKGDTGLGGPDPWSDIHTFGFGVIFGAHMSNEWKIFGGPVFQFSAESGASFSEGFIGGGFVGTSYQVSPDLKLGGGVGVVSQIERSTRVFPVVLIDWQITDQLKLTTETRAGASGDTGLELVYDWGGGFETAIGGTYRFRRFRLDDSALASEGVGQHSSFPFWVRLTHHFNPNFSLNVVGGAVLAGELRLLDNNGSRIGEEDYDPGAFVGVSGSFRF